MSNKIALSLRIFYILYFSQDLTLFFSHYYKLLKLTPHKQILKIKFGLDTAMRLCTRSEIASLESSQDFRQKHQDPNRKRKKKCITVYHSGKVLLGNCIISTNCVSLPVSQAAQRTTHLSLYSQSDEGIAKQILNTSVPPIQCFYIYIIRFCIYLRLFFFLKITILFYLDCFTYTYDCAQCPQLSAVGARENAISARSGGIDSSELPRGFCELSLGAVSALQH